MSDGTYGRSGLSVSAVKSHVTDEGDPMATADWKSQVL